MSSVGIINVEISVNNQSKIYLKKFSTFGQRQLYWQERIGMTQQKKFDNVNVSQRRVFQRPNRRFLAARKRRFVVRRINR